MKQQQCHIELFQSTHSTMCADRISLTLVCLCFVCLCSSANVCVGETHAAPVLYKWPPCLCGFVPGAADAWIMWCGALGATSAQPSWDHLSMWPSICIKWRNGFASSRRKAAASAVRRRRVRETNPPAGGIRCYLSDWEQHHQSLLSASLCLESNQRRVIHLRWWRADKISNRACQNFATLACCVKEIVMMYLSLQATGSAQPVIKPDAAVPSLHSSSRLPGAGWGWTLHFLLQLKLTRSECLPGPDTSEKAETTCSY